MNRQEAKQLLPIIQAFAEGKDIQIKNSTEGWYGGLEDMAFTSAPECYRIKPELVKIRHRRYVWKTIDNREHVSILDDDICYSRPRSLRKSTGL